MNFYLPAHQGFAREKAPASVAPNWEKEDTFLLTSKQRRLVAMMDYRAARRMPTLHRDLAKILGIRRDSLKKLLRRTRKRLAEEGRDQSMNAKDAKDAKSAEEMQEEGFSWHFVFSRPSLGVPGVLGVHFLESS